MSQILEIQLSEKTKRKLGALAILSGKGYDQLEAEFAEIFDRLVSQEIANLVGFTKIAADDQDVEAEESPQEARSTLSKSMAQKAAEEPFEQDEVSSHSLSHDEDPGEPEWGDEVLPGNETEIQPPLPPARSSLSQQKVEDEPPAFNIPEVEDAGQDAERFLDDLFGPGAPQQEASRGDRVATAKKTFNPKKPRVRVSDALE